MLTLKGFNERRHNGFWFVRKLFKNRRILESLLNRLVVEAWAVDAEGRGVLVLTMEDGAIKGGLELGDGRFCNMIGDLLGMF